MLIVVNLISCESRYREGPDVLYQISNLVIPQPVYYQKIDTIHIYEMNSKCLGRRCSSFVVSVNLDHSGPNSDISPAVAFKFFLHSRVASRSLGFRMIVYVRAL